MLDLKGKVVVVTGGNTGLGLAYSKAFARSGANLVVTGHGVEQEEIRTYAHDCGVGFLFMRGDLLEDDFIDCLVKSTLDRFGRIDVLVNNAGIIRRSPVLEHSVEDFLAVLEINLVVVFKLCQRIGKVMCDQGGGKIINIASLLSFHGGLFVPGYTASKHGVVGITKSFASELSCFNVNVNAVAPGYVITNNTKPIREDEVRYNDILGRIALGRWANPDDICGAVLFLASSLSDYVCGVVLPVDGGYLIR